MRQLGKRGAVTPGMGLVGGNTGKTGRRWASPGRPWCRRGLGLEYRGDGVSGSPEITPTRPRGAFPERLTPSWPPGRKQTFLLGPTRHGSGSRGLQTALGRSGERKRACLGASPTHARPAGKSRLPPSMESPAPVLIWAAGSGSASGPTSLLPNLVWMSRGPGGGKALRSSRVGGASP